MPNEKYILYESSGKFDLNRKKLHVVGTMERTNMSSLKIGEIIHNLLGYWEISSKQHELVSEGEIIISLLVIKHSENSHKIVLTSETSPFKFQ